MAKFTMSMPTKRPAPWRGPCDAELLTFVSNVPGVLDPHGEVLASLTAVQTTELIHNKVINGGMIPKVQAALQVVAQGVPQARIVNLAGLGSGGGTMFTM